MALWTMTKHERKLLNIFDKANSCTSRKDSKKLILKADELRAKLLATQPLSDAS